MTDTVELPEPLALRLEKRLAELEKELKPGKVKWGSGGMRILAIGWFGRTLAGSVLAGAIAWASWVSIELGAIREELAEVRAELAIGCRMTGAEGIVIIEAMLHRNAATRDFAPRDEDNLEQALAGIRARCSE